MEQHTEYYRAMVAKDSRFDGVFFGGLRRPEFIVAQFVVKTPRETSCVFFTSAS